MSCSFEGSLHFWPTDLPPPTHLPTASAGVNAISSVEMKAMEEVSCILSTGDLDLAYTASRLGGLEIKYWFPRSLACVQEL